jgi:hypothetical protein
MIRSVEWEATASGSMVLKIISLMANHFPVAIMAKPKMPLTNRDNQVVDKLI